MFKVIRIISLISACMLHLTANAGVVMGGTRVIFAEGKKEVTLSVTNEDKTIPYLIESWIENADKNNHTRVPFVVTPPLFRLDADKENLLRINYLGMPLPENRESVFWLNVKSISPTPRDKSNQLQVNIKSKFKLFYRPKGLAGNPADAWQKLAFRQQGNQLIAHNPTPYYVSFYTLSVNHQAINDPGMIGPGEDRHWTVSHVGPVSWSAINDYGGVTEERTR
ncbi:fimbrial biogenesis chaperone [Pantoea anthophila]|uniref:fimbrial biogenesis chaperone n=1 Tax=Pantoea anthophila TaxID=470931 RepID=UPI000614B1B2|nr:molecular chaperone [Pantoea anthophila]KKB03156.1 fimbrial assembly protein [Pantoea anthophila]